MKKELDYTESFDKAVYYHQNNQLDQAKDMYLNVLKIKHDHLGANNNIGLIFNIIGEYNKAIDHFERVLLIDPNYLDSLYNLGLTFSTLGENKIAIEYFEKIIKINPYYTHSPFFNIGLIHHELGNNEKAIEYYKQSIKINPNYAVAYGNLGLLFYQLGENNKSLDFYEQAIKINPNEPVFYLNLGITYTELGEYKKTISCYLTAIEINKNIPNIEIALVNLLKLPLIENFMKSNHESVKKLFICLFNSNNIDHIDVFHNAFILLFKYDNYSQLENILNSNSSLLNNEIVQKLLKEELFQLIIQKCLCANIFLEKLLTKLRSEILQTYLNFSRDNKDNKDNTDILNKNYAFISSMAEQCYLNEYIWFQSNNEIHEIKKLADKINFSDDIYELEITIITCYLPLNTLKRISTRIAKYKTYNILFKKILDIGLVEPLLEAELSESIDTTYITTDPVSKKIRQQYEETPHNKWKYTNKPKKFNFFYNLNMDIKPNIFEHKITYDDNNLIIEYQNKFKRPNVLIAGCGTGIDTVLATRYKNSNILGVDLSKASLAFAKRKTEELNFINIDFLHTDILQLKNLDKKFDVIECTGALHHLKDPNAGIKILLDILEPHGFLKLGLFSESSKVKMTNAKEFVKKNKLPNTNEAIRNCREEIMNNSPDPLISNITNNLSFYSMSAIKDLLFYDHEHFFTLTKIHKILKDFDLEFLGFNFQNLSTHKDFSKLFPNDKKNISLDNWKLFENNNPNIFSSMYQFWVRQIR